MARISKTQLKETYHKVDNRIVRTIVQLGSSEDAVPLQHPRVHIQGEHSYENLISAARRYDIDNFFVLHKKKQKSDLKFVYRTLLKGYQFTRDSGVSLVKKLYKLRYDR